MDAVSAVDSPLGDCEWHSLWEVGGSDMPAGICITHTGGHAAALAVTIPHHCLARLQESRMLPRSCALNSCASGASCVTRVDSCSWQHFEELFLPSSMDAHML